jgi:hypothetical protein
MIDYYPGSFIDIESLHNRLLKVCYVLATSAHLPRLFFAVAIKSTNEANKAGSTHILSSLYYLDVYDVSFISLGQVKKILKDLKKRNDRRKNSQITFSQKILIFLLF